MPNLGDKVRDKITGHEGIVIARTEWLYGCVRYVVQGQTLHEGKPTEPHTFDEDQLVVLKADALNDSEEKPAGGDRDYVATRR
jgi:hypothetical protein